MVTLPFISDHISPSYVVFNLLLFSDFGSLQISTEAMTMVQALISQSPDIQKVLAFEGAFEKLFNIVTQEGGVDGGAVASSALTCVDGLLRFNTSNQV